ncbi:efflux RND transporter periplasmic adaptor subunit [Paenibacillus filicis]|uniref:Efflux RND transporter periplasmic adaptor subunit n=1 Tax=Paenibacillus gyeongsangnamensis TaxID=3388067 RepID=A0ABT4Q923_9BACL|nr:efflux RND transporter periplasmic adaptor subunit [Paenibacillus filicis]MCZ8513291.1 efflux RND transporter periplasmic adaptor subunit [Paenibacillus filicis]
MTKVSTAKSRNRKHCLRALAIVAVAAAIAAGCSAPGGKGQATVNMNLDNKPVKTETIAKHKISDPREQIADVAAISAMDIMPKASGQVTQVMKKRGDTVQAGEVLFQIDSRDAESAARKSQIALGSAQDSLAKSREDMANSRKDLQSAVTRAQEQLDNAQKDYSKARNDYDDGKVTQRQVEQAQTALNNAQMDLQSQQNKLAALDSTNQLAAQVSQVESSQVGLSDAQRALENYDVKAPVSGVLTDFSVEVGSSVSPSVKAGQVQQIDPIKIKAELTEASYQLVKNKQQLTYYTPDNPASKGTAQIKFLASVMSASTKTYPLELEVANADQKLKPGTRVLLQLTTESEEQVVAVPTLSIVREGADSYVFVLQGDTVQKRKITLGRLSDTYQEVLSGVKEGEQLVTSGQHQLKDGQKVEVAKPAPAGGAANPAAEPSKK